MYQRKISGKIKKNWKGEKYLKKLNLYDLLILYYRTIIRDQAIVSSSACQVMYCIILHIHFLYLINTVNFNNNNFKKASFCWSLPKYKIKYSFRRRKILKKRKVNTFITWKFIFFLFYNSIWECWMNSCIKWQSNDSEHH